ncbi:cellulose binding domain-containing protein [Actinoplanes sp. LDG1-06]|uniref:Cellulose binding domain-containing protein n=2 Tax=Paractinoplanes ovalisporus TaxID=2810368 RepID=A0ABS2AB43_9ACTN|nr:cellulose binding domain-containing protein [Actinoplanes ovalisporus]
MAWSWGVSRIIDVIEQSGGTILRPDATGVTGCSRFGKGAFVIGAFDQRIALTMPIESGTAGAPIFRGVPGEGAQSLSSAYGEQPWLGDAFGSFTGSPQRLPVDTHEIAAMVAPRGLFIMDNPHIANLGPRSASVAALGAAEVYKALGAGDAISYWSDVTDGTHCASRSEWRTPLQQNIRRHLLKTANDPGVIRISAKAQGRLSDWATWTTPTLDSTPPPSTPPPSTPPPSTPPPSTPPPSTPPPSTPPPSTPPPSTPPPSTPPPSTPPPASGCTASASVNAWTGGFVATVRVTAGSTPVNGWTVGITLASGATVTNSWNANRTGTTGALQFTNVAYNGQIPAGGYTEFGFQATGSPGTLTPSCS